MTTDFDSFYDAAIIRQRKLSETIRDCRFILGRIYTELTNRPTQRANTQFNYVLANQLDIVIETFEQITNDHEHALWDRRHKYDSYYDLNPIITQVLEQLHGLD